MLLCNFIIFGTPLYKVLVRFKNLPNQLKQNSLSKIWTFIKGALNKYNIYLFTFYV